MPTVEPVRVSDPFGIGPSPATFITPVVYPNMILFIGRWIEPIAEFVGETRGTRKLLGGAAGTAPRP